MKIRSEVEVNLSANDIREAILDFMKKKSPGLTIAASEIYEDPDAEAGWRIKFINDKISVEDLADVAR